MDVTKFRDGRVHIRNSGVNGLIYVDEKGMCSYIQYDLGFNPCRSKGKFSRRQTEDIFSLFFFEENKI